MSDFNFNLIASSISIKFTCPFCNEENETDGYYVPEPDYSAETGHESTNSEYYKHNCIKCDELFNIELHNSYNGGYGQIESDSDNGIDINDIDIEEYYNDFYDDYDYNTEVGYYEDFKREIVEIYFIVFFVE